MSRTARKPKLSGSFVAYYRVSTERQGESGLGLEAQRASVARYLAIVKGLLECEYTEVETGKKHGHRPQLAAAIAEAKRRQATLLIAKLDRLARNVHFISGLMESAADFVAVDMPAANRLTIHIMAAFAEHEGAMISQRTREGLASVKRELAEKGFRISHTGRRFTSLGNPRWREALEKAWKAHRKHPQPAQVLEIIKAYRTEGATLRVIAARLNAMELKTASHAAWHPSTVRAALLNRP